MLLAACHSGGAPRTLVALRPACCETTPASAAKLEEGKQALAKQDVDAAQAAFAQVVPPMDHATNVTLWEQKGIASAYVDDEAGARAAFDRLLLLDPGHFLSYTLSPKATFVFERVRDQPRTPPAVDVSWERGAKVGEPIPVDVEVVADPAKLLAKGVLFVRTRGEQAWRSADVGLNARLVLPPVVADKPASLELYLRAYDAQGNETLAWASPTAPREIALRYDPPTPWWRRPWVIAVAGTVLAAAVGITVYELELAPPDKITGPVH